MNKAKLKQSKRKCKLSKKICKSLDENNYFHKQFKILLQHHSIIDLLKYLDTTLSSVSTSKKSKKLKEKTQYLWEIREVFSGIVLHASQQSSDEATIRSKVQELYIIDDRKRLRALADLGWFLIKYKLAPKEDGERRILSSLQSFYLECAAIYSSIPYRTV